MRDWIVIGAILASLPFCFRKPFVGILLWCIISYANPHRYTWGFAYNFPVAMLVGAVTILGWCFSPNKGRLPPQRETYMLLGLWLIFVITTIGAIYPDNARVLLEKVSKILLMTVLSLYVVDTKRKFEIFILVIVLSVAIVGVKGGIWGIMSGMKYRLWGPEGSTLGDNNDVGLALNMISPIILAFTKVYKNKWVRALFWVIFGLSLFSVILTRSRGAFLGFIAISLGMAWRSPKRFIILPILIILAPTLYSLLPEQYRERMHTIETYDQDRSAMGRVNAWWFAFNLSKNRPLVGGGFECFEPEMFQIYAPDPTFFQGAHSIYFAMLGEHGYPGLILFLALVASSMLKLSNSRRLASSFAGMEWVHAYASAFQIGLLGYLVSGAFLGRAYFDLFYHLIAATIILQEVFYKEIVSTIHMAIADVQASPSSAEQ